jgi:hypothetical protein
MRNQIKKEKKTAYGYLYHTNDTPFIPFISGHTINYQQTLIISSIISIR